MLSWYLHGETFNTVVLKAAAPNLATLPPQRQDYELEESDTKNMFPEGTEDFQTWAGNGIIGGSPGTNAWKTKVLQRTDFRRSYENINNWKKSAENINNWML